MFPEYSVLSEEDPLRIYKSTSDPDTMYIHEAMKNPDAIEFFKAIQNELEYQLDNLNVTVMIRREIPQDATVLTSAWQMIRKR